MSSVGANLEKSLVAGNLKRFLAGKRNFSFEKEGRLIAGKGT